MERLSITKTNISYAIFIGIYLSLSVIAGVLIPDGIPLWLNIIISEIVILAPIIGIMMFFRITPKNILMLSKVRVTDFILTYIAAYCLMPLIYFINYITSFFARNYVNDMVSELTPYPLVIQLIMMALLPALAEEFIFRGFFYGSFRRRNILGAALMSGIFFGIAHLNINQFAYAMVIGIAFCILYEASGNLFISVTAHFAINANTVLIMALLNSSDSDLTAGVEAATETEAVSEILAPSVGMVMIIAAVFLVFSIIGCTLFSFIIKKIAAHNNRLEALTDAFRHPFKTNMEGRFVDIFFLVTVVLLIAYMVLLEIAP